jgi:hypothetical protein
MIYAIYFNLTLNFLKGLSGKNDGRCHIFRYDTLVSFDPVPYIHIGLLINIHLKILKCKLVNGNV